MTTQNASQAPTVNEQRLTYVLRTSGQPQSISLQIEMRGNDPCFLAKDVCDFLGIGNTTESLRNLDEDEKLTSVVLRAGQAREMNFVTESGLYSLVFQSRKPEAKKFRKWVTNEVLPSIRKYGFYIPDTNGIEGKLKDVAFDYFGEAKRKGYQYRAALRALGLNPNTTYANSWIKLYPKEFNKREGIWFICEKFLEVLAINKAYRQSVNPLKEKIKMLPSMGYVQIENQLNLFANEKEGGLL